MLYLLNSLWPAGYVPPSVLARQEKEAKCERGREHKKEAGLCWQEEEPRPKDSKKQRAGIIVTAKRRINKNENDNTSKKNKADPNKETKGRGLKGEVEKGEAERPKEQAAKKATSLQNNEEVGNKSVQKNARKKGKHEEHNVSVKAPHSMIATARCDGLVEIRKRWFYPISRGAIISPIVLYCWPQSFRTLSRQRFQRQTA